MDRSNKRWITKQKGIYRKYKILCTHIKTEFMLKHIEVYTFKKWMYRYKLYKYRSIKRLCKHG